MKMTVLRMLGVTVVVAIVVMGIILVVVIVVVVTYNPVPELSFFSLIRTI